MNADRQDKQPLADPTERPASATINEKEQYENKQAISIRKQAVLLFGLLMFSYAYVHQWMGWNQNSRLDLLHALFVHQTFQIDADHENTGDKSLHDGHYYSDKAPGIVFVAIPAFAVSIGILHVLQIPLDSRIGWLASSWITTVGSVGLITALGGVAMFLFLCRFVEQRPAFITTMVTFLGAAPFPYATMLFSHAAVIGLICIALYAIADPLFMFRVTGGKSSGENGRQKCFVLAHDDGTAHWFRRYFLAGLCCGLAISSEYTAATAAGGILVLALLVGWKRGAVLALGAIPPLLLIPMYNSICFGGPLAFGYHNLALPEFQEMNKGLFGITFPPKASSAYMILFSPARGLFFWTPFFFLAFVGLRTLRKTSRLLLSVSLVVIVLQVLFISGYYMPNGGAALGPRHLAPLVPFVMLCAATGVSVAPRLGVLLGFCSLFLTGIATLISAMPPEKEQNPLLSFYLPRFLRGDFNETLGSFIGLPERLSILVLLLCLLLPLFHVSLQINRKSEN